MEVWLSILISGVLTAISIVIGGYQFRKGFEQTGKAIERAIEAIHADIKHSQEKIERKIEK